MSDLITSSRATQNATLSKLNASNSAYLDSLISAASGMIQNYCHRDFIQTNYSEYYNGAGYPYVDIILRQSPVIGAPSRLAVRPASVINIRNDGSTAQRATFATVDSGTGTCASLKLAWVASGVAATQTISCTSNVTLAALATAINAVGSGWFASTVTEYTLYPSADLTPSQGPYNAMTGGSPLEMLVDDATYLGPFAYNGFAWDDAVGYRFDADLGIIRGRFPQGTRNIRIDYTAGYATIPDPVQEACVALIQDIYQSSLVNNNLVSAKLGDASMELRNGRFGIDERIKSMIKPYVDMSRLLRV